MLTVRHCLGTAEQRDHAMTLPVCAARYQSQNRHALTTCSIEPEKAASLALSGETVV